MTQHLDVVVFCIVTSERLKCLIFRKSADPVEKSHSMTSHLGFHCSFIGF